LARSWSSVRGCRFRRHAEGAGAPEIGGQNKLLLGFGAEGIARLASNLRDRFGLRVTKSHGPVEYWVVDRVESPTEN